MANSIPNIWALHRTVGIDITSVNIGIHDTIKSRVPEHNSAIMLLTKASDELCSHCGFDVEELCIDTYYWFDKSTNGLKNIALFVTKNMEP